MKKEKNYSKKLFTKHEILLVSQVEYLNKVIIEAGLDIHRIILDSPLMQSKLKK